MSQRNREKRAAKKRARARRGPTPPRDFGGAEEFRPPPLPSPEVVAHTLTTAAREPRPAEWASCAAQLTAELAGTHRHALASGAALATSRILPQIWNGGWLPADLWEIARRETDELACSLLVDVIAADTARHAAATVHERWAAQLGQLEAEVWWQRDRPHLLQWPERVGIGIEQALHTVIALLSLLHRLPKLPRILPPPGTSTAAVSAAAAGVDQKVLSRVRALLAKAESTQFPQEAEALSAKAQELMHRHAFERALLDDAEQRPQEATSIRIWLESPYVEAKAQLIHSIAAANRCKSIFESRLGFVSLVGTPLDLDITELLATSLLVQASRAMLAEGRHVSRTGTSRTRSFRQSFLIAYAARIGERLEEAAASELVADERLLPVLADRSRVVEDTFAELFEHVVYKRVSVSNGAGWAAGRAAADRADIAIERGEVSA